MPQTIPDSLLQFAVDGVVPASAIQASVELRRRERFARKRARAMVEQAARHAEDLRAQALAEGYRRGMQLALDSLGPLVDALRQEQASLRRAIWQEITAALRSIATTPGVAAAQIEAACLEWGASAGEGPSPVLHLPMDQPSLAEALRALPALAGVDIRLARREHPMLEVGHLVYELALEASLSVAAGQALDQSMPQLEQACTALAASYSRDVQEAASAAAAAERFSRLRQWE